MAEIRDRRSYHVAIQRVGGSRHHLLPVRSHGHHARSLEALDDRLVDEFVDHREREGLTDSDDLERRALCLIESAEAIRHQFGETGRAVWKMVEAPQALALLEEAESRRLHDELAKIQQVTAAPFPEPRRAQRLDGTVQCDLDDVAHGVLIE